jgi:thioesterase domain-containing protein/acyl carrier protein
MAPSAFVLMEALPLTANGKINRRALPPPDESTTTQDSTLTTPRDALELQLSQIWKEVLRREHIGLRDNFFDLGGHSLLAVRLLHNVERSFGQKIPVSTFFQGATIEQLAATLRERGGEVREHSLVSIQPRGSRPPLFLVHSASGNVMSYIALSRQLGREQPVYGLQSRGLDPDRKPTTRVEDMASEYLRELITMQPEGPYHLGGWSMGGVIAFEMARQLTAEGKSLAPLVLIDSTIHLRRVKKNGLDDASVLLALAQHHGLFLDETDKTFEDLRSLTLDEQLEYFFEKAANSNLIPYDIGLAQLRHLFDLFKVNYHAAENYRPRKSAQQVILFQAAGTPPAEAAKKLKQWKKVAEVVTVQRLPGDHYSILSEPNVSVLAEKLTPYLPN